MATEFERLGSVLPVGVVERVADRTQQAKVFDLPNGKRRLFHSLGVVHYEDAGLQDIDLTPTDLGDRWRVDRAPYVVEVMKATLEVRYTSRRGGDVTLTLTKLDGVSPVLSLNPVVAGNVIEFDDVVPDLDVHVVLGTDGVRLFKTLKSAAAPVEAEWSVSQSTDFKSSVLTNIKGHDAKDIRVAPTAPPLRRNAELTNVKGTVSRVGGRDEYTITEAFTGRVSEVINFKTRERAFKTDVVYPVVIDPDITEVISTGADDGFSYSYHVTLNQYLTYTFASAGYSAGSTYNRYWWAGFRFQTIALDQAVTIDLANLKVNVLSRTGSPSTLVHADDVDDAAAWSTGSRIKDITKTAASTAFAPTTDGVKTIAVTAIVQEIVDRGSWATGNDMRFSFFDNAAPTGTMVKLECLEHAGTAHAVLEIDFTVAAGTVALSGTAIAGGVLEAEVRAGGETLILTLTGDTWVATVGADNAITDALIAGIVGDDAGTNGWDAEVTITHTDVARTSDTVVTITLPASANYFVGSDETVNVAVPATAVTLGVAPAAVNFTVTSTAPTVALSGAAVTGGVLESEIAAGGETLVLTLSNDLWDATVGADNAVTDALIAGITGDDPGSNGWDVEVSITFNEVARTSDSVVTITLPASAGYDVAVDETVTVAVPASAVQGTEAPGPQNFVVTNEAAPAPASGPRTLFLSGLTMLTRFRRLLDR